MLNLSLRPHSQSYFHNQREATSLIKLACWQSVFTVCVNAPLWGTQRKSSAHSYWFSPLKANSFSWVSAVHSDPAVNIDFSVFSSQCACVCVCVWFVCLRPEVHHRDEQPDWPLREMCFLTTGFIVILLQKLISRFCFQHSLFSERRVERSASKQKQCVCVFSKLSFIFKSLESHLIPGVFTAPWISEEIRALLSNLVLCGVTQTSNQSISTLQRCHKIKPTERFLIPVLAKNKKILYCQHIFRRLACWSPEVSLSGFSFPPRKEKQH